MTDALEAKYMSTMVKTSLRENAAVAALVRHPYVMRQKEILLSHLISLVALARIAILPSQNELRGQAAPDVASARRPNLICKSSFHSSLLALL